MHLKLNNNILSVTKILMDFEVGSSATEAAYDGFLLYICTSQW